VVLAVIALGLVGRPVPVVGRTPCSCTPTAPLLIDIGEVLGLLAGYGVIIPRRA